MAFARACSGVGAGCPGAGCCARAAVTARVVDAANSASRCTCLVMIASLQNVIFSPGWMGNTFTFALPSAAWYSAGVPASCGIVP